MSADNATQPDDGYHTAELHAMDEETARAELTVNQFERWEKIQDLHESAAENREQWEQEAETVHDLTVNADLEALGTEVDLYGNDVLVHINEDRDGEAFEAVAEELQATIGEVTPADADDLDPEDIPDLDDEDTETLVRAFAQLYDIALARWNGTDWADLPEHEREAILESAREQWGASAFIMGVFDCLMAIREQQAESQEAVESFLGETGRGRR